MSSLEVETHVTHGPVHISWAPAKRLAVVWADADDHITGDVARTIVGALRTWVDDDQPFGVVCDCSNVGRTDAEWRAVWFEFLKHERRRAGVAWTNSGPAIRVIILMFTKALRTVDAFDCTVASTNADAHRWLTDRGCTL